MCALSQGSELRVVVADDNRPFRSLVREWIDADPRFEVVAEVENGRDAVARFTDDPEPVLLIDLEMPLLDGFAAATVIRRLYPLTRIVMLTGTSVDPFHGLQLRTVVDALHFKSSIDPAVLTEALYGRGGPSHVGDRRPARLRRRETRSATRKQLVPSLDGGGEVDDALVGRSRMSAQQLERFDPVHAVSLHQDPNSPLDDGAPSHRVRQLIELGKPEEDDLHRVLPGGAVVLVRDVREDTALCRFRDEGRVRLVQQRDHGARGLVDDLVDQVERVPAVRSQPDDRNVRRNLHRRRPDLRHRDLLADDLVAEALDDSTNGSKPVDLLARNQHTQRRHGRLRHRQVTVAQVSVRWLKAVQCAAPLLLLPAMHWGGSPGYLGVLTVPLTALALDRRLTRRLDVHSTFSTHKEPHGAHADANTQ